MLDNDITQLPDAVRDIARLYLDQIAVLTQKIDELHFKLRAATKVDDAMRRLCTVPGVGPVTAGAIMAFAPDLCAFASGRNVAAWLGLVPRQRSTDRKTSLGGASKMDQAVTTVKIILQNWGRPHTPRQSLWARASFKCLPLLRSTLFAGSNLETVDDE